MKKKKTCRLLSCIVAVIMLVTMVPLNGIVAFAEEVSWKINEMESSPSTIRVTSENVTEEDLRDPLPSFETDNDDVTGKLVDVGEYHKTYLDDSGVYTSVITGVPNYFIDDKGKMSDYDNTLIEKNHTFESDEIINKNSNIDISLSEKFSTEGISFDYDDVKITLIPVEGDYSAYSVVDNAIRYNNVFEGVDIQYTVSELGVNEYIILNKHIEKNVFSYKIDTNGNTVELVDNTLVVKKAGSKNIAYTISAPFMSDAAGEISQNIKLSFKENVLTVTADADWLSDLNRAYPVIIDPDISTSGELTTKTVKSGGLYASDKYGYAGWIDNDATGNLGVIGSTKLMIQIGKSFFGNVPDGIVVKNAELYIHQYGGLYNNRQGTKKQNQLFCYRVGSPWSFSTIKYDTQIKRYFLSEQPNKVGDKHFDISDAVTAWCNGEADQYGLCIDVSDGATGSGAAFYTATSGNAAGQGGFSPDQIPKITVSYELPNPVPDNYSLGATTINLRTLTKSSVDGTLAFQGIFADGLAAPSSAVHYWMNDSSITYENATVSAIKQKHYPNSISEKSKDIWNKLPEGTTKYRRFVSNWQTLYPFVNPEYNKVYQFSAQASKGGSSGNVVNSDKFLVYKITQYDTLQNIARYYGVSLSQMAKDNNVQDMLLVDNNTIVIINPSQNLDVPYNPPTLSESDKRMIDGMLMGRGKHCEFGFEPVNLNTGNFYMDQTDISISDLNGDFAINRSYNSKGSEINSVFGRGWQFDYAEQLSKLSNGTITYRRGDGSTVHFYPNGKGEYVCDEGYYLDLSTVVVGTKTASFDGIDSENIDNDNIEAREKFYSKSITYNVYEYEIKNSSGEIRRFSKDGQLISITDKKGFKTTLNYDENGMLSSIKSAGGISYEISCDSMGKITAVSVPGGTIRYSYNNAGDLVKYTDENGNETIYNYDSKHRMVSWVDADGHTVTSNTYDSEGRVTVQTDSEGNTTRFAYSDGKTIVTDANKNTTIYNYDKQYRTTSIVYADGSVEKKEYDDNNNLKKEIDRTGNSISYSYNSDGLITKEIRSIDGATRQYEYNKDNDLTRFTDYDGKSTVSTYDENGDLVVSTDKNGNTETFVYDTKHRVVSTTDANGNTTKFDYGDIWVSKITDAEGNSTDYYYNGRGQVVSSVNALNETTRYIYDAAGRKTGIQYADGTSETYTYEKSGTLKSLKTANGKVYNYTSDGIGNTTSLTDPAGGVVSYAYDGLYNKTSTKYPDGSVEKVTYDAFGNKITVTDAENNVVAYTYDKANNILSSKDANGNVTAYTYDMRFNKPLTSTDASGAKTSFKYDAVGNLLSITYANGSVQSYKYDANGNVIQSVAPNGLIIDYKYDAVGNKLEEKSSSGTTVSYTYDKVYDVTSVTYNGESTKKYVYDALKRLTSETDAVGSVTLYSYDSKNNILSQTDASNRTISYTYDGIGNVLTEKDSDGGITTYEYDALDRVVKTIDALGNSSIMKYDSVGNTIAAVNALGNKTENLFNKTGLVLKTKASNGSTSKFEYDNNGNLISTTDAEGYKSSIEYDAMNRIVKTTDPLGLITEYSYDSMGNLIAEKDNNGTNNKYEFDIAGNMISSTDALGQKNTYSYDLNGNLVEIKSYDGTTTRYTYDLYNNLTSVTYPDSTKDIYTYDLVGNVTKMSKNGREYTYKYDKVNRLSSVTDPLAQTTAYEYNIFDLITKTINADGSTLINKYDKVGNLISSTDGNGKTTSYAYDAVYNLKTATFANNSTNTYLYDSVGNLIAFTDNNGNKTQYKYSPLGYVTSKRTANSAVTNYTNDAAGNVLTETNALGNTTKYTYSKASQLLSQTLANGAEYTVSYDALGRTVKTTEPVSLSTTYKYNNKGDVVSVIDQSGRVTSYTYDFMHRIITSTDAKGNATKFAYDANGNLSSLISATGAVTKYTYDAIDQVTSELDPVGKLSEFKYNPVGNLTSVTETGGRVTSYTYDKAGNITSEKNAKGNKKTYTYDSVYNLISASDYKGNKTKYAYDKNGNLLSIADRLNNKTVYTYDSMNNQISAIDPEGRKTKYAYDELNRLIGVTEADSITSEYTYDEVGNVTYAAGYTYTYDLAGNVTSSKDALGNVTEYIYNVNGMLETVKNANGTKVNYDYDELDRLIKKSYDKENVGLYTYDADGNRISMDDVAGKTGYEYDKNGRITAVKLSNGTSKIGYDYDIYGNITKLSYPDGTSVAYKYDEINQLIAITNREGKNTSFKYDANGNVIEVHRPNNTYTLLSYDNEDRVTDVRNYGICDIVGLNNRTILLSEYRYSYDDSGNITKESKFEFKPGSDCKIIDYIIARLLNKTETKTYSYDGRNQVTEEGTTTSRIFFLKDKKTDAKYEYDKFGNRVSKTTKDGTTKYEYNKANQLIKEKTKDGTIKYSYDKNGNLVEVENPGCLGKTETYTYNAENKLTSVKEGKNLLMAALYDGDGERIFTITSNSCLDLPCVDDKNAKNLKRKDSNEIDINDDMIINSLFIPNGVKSCDYLNYDVTGYINDINTEYTQVLMEYGANEKVTAAYEYGVNRESANIDNDQYYYEYDGRGSVSTVTNSKGKSVTTYSYDAYGNVTQKGKNIANPYGYNGEYTDDATNLQYLRARYYNPSTGSFTTVDTHVGNIKTPLSLNRYIYTHNNPISGKDPSGHGLIGALVGGTIGAVAGAAGEIVRGVTSGKGVNWGNVAKSAAKGAVVGALAGAFPLAAATVAIVSGSVKLAYDTGKYISNTISNNQQRRELAKSSSRSVSGKYGSGEGSEGGQHYYYDKYSGKTLFFTDFSQMQAYKKLCEGKEKLNKEFASTAMHDVLNLTAAIPGCSEISVVANSALYIVEGDYGTATESLVSLGLSKTISRVSGKVAESKWQEAKQEIESKLQNEQQTVNNNTNSYNVNRLNDLNSRDSGTQHIVDRHGYNSTGTGDKFNSDIDFSSGVKNNSQFIETVSSPDVVASNKNTTVGGNEVIKMFDTPIGTGRNGENIFTTSAIIDSGNNIKSFYPSGQKYSNANILLQDAYNLNTIKGITSSFAGPFNSLIGTINDMIP